MNELYTVRDKIVEFYSERTKIVEMVGRFIVGLLIFTYINNHIGFMEVINKGIVAFGLAAVCAVLPLVFLAVIAMAITILHIYSLSMVLAGCVAIVFLLMFILYFRFTSELVLVVLLTPIALAMGVPYVIPIVCGLLVGPMAAIPMSLGVVAYYLLGIIENMATMDTIGELSMDGAVSDALGFSVALLDCTDMIYFIVVLSVGLWVVNGVRRIHMSYAWKIAIGSGVVAMVLVSMITTNMIEYEVAFGVLFLDCIIGGVLGIVLEFMFLDVDYKRTEYLEFEDDEYYYCVKAVPRVKGAEKIVTKKRTKNRSDKVEVANSEEMYSEEGAVDTLYDEEVLEAEMLDVAMMDETEQEGSNQTVGAVDGSQMNDATMVLNTEEIERELRNNAHAKASRSKNSKKRHAKTNYKMLKDSVKKELNRK